MALADAQLLAAMRRTIARDRVQFDLRPYRDLTPAETEALDQAARRYGEYLRLKRFMKVVRYAQIGRLCVEGGRLPNVPAATECHVRAFRHQRPGIAECTGHAAL
jgi:hypothetical protein